MIKKSCVLVAMVSLVALGCAMTLKAAIGVGAWDALTATISGIVGIHIGTMIIILNFACIITQMLILRKEFRKVQLLQFPVSILFGSIINFMLYDIFSVFTVNIYYMRVLLLIGGYICCAFGVAAVMVMNMITFPLEGACLAVSEKLKKKFHVVRQLTDVISVLILLLLVFVFHQELAIREGTIIGVLLFGPLMGIFMKFLNPIFKRNKLLYNDK